MTTALDWLGILRIEDGRRWVDAAYGFQIDDATAVLMGERPYNFLTRPRGASTTTDLAAIARDAARRASSRPFESRRGHRMKQS